MAKPKTKKPKAGAAPGNPSTSVTVSVTDSKPVTGGVDHPEVASPPPPASPLAAAPLPAEPSAATAPAPHPVVTITIPTKRRLRLEPCPPELLQELTRQVLTKGKGKTRLVAATEKLYEIREQGIETDLGYLYRILVKLEELGVDYGQMRIPYFPKPDTSGQWKQGLTLPEQEMIQDLITGIGGGHLVIPPAYDPSPLFMGIVRAFKDNRVLISVPTTKRMKEVMKFLNFRQKKGEKSFQMVKGKQGNIPDHAVITHQMLPQVDDDNNTDILIVEEAHLISGPQFQQAVRKLNVLKFGVTTKTANNREDKVMLLEGVFGLATRWKS